MTDGACPSSRPVRQGVRLCGACRAGRQPESERAETQAGEPERRAVRRGTRPGCCRLAEQRGLKTLCRALFNTNEFLTVD